MNGSVERPYRDILYSNSDMEVTEELKQYISSQGVIMEVENILKHKYDKKSKTYRLLIKWIGLEEIENTCNHFLI